MLRSECQGRLSSSRLGRFDACLTRDFNCCHYWLHLECLELLDALGCFGVSVCLESLVKNSLHPLNHHVIESLIFAELGHMETPADGPHVEKKAWPGSCGTARPQTCPGQEYSVDVDDFQVVSESQSGACMRWHWRAELIKLTHLWAGHAYQSAGGQPAKGNVSCFRAGEMEHLCGLQLGQQRITTCDRSPSPPDWSLNAAATGRIEKLHVPSPNTPRLRDQCTC